MNTAAMDKIIKHTAVIILLLCSFGGYAQFESNFTQYMFNPLIYNPAYAGNNDQASITFVNRAQWTGIQGAPYTAALSAHSKTFEEELGLGVSVLHDRLGVETATSFSIDAAYHIKIGVHKMLAFGLRGSGFSYNTNLDELGNASNDPLLQGGLSRFSGNIGTGVFLYAKQYYAGLSVPSLLTPKLDESGAETVNTKNQNIYLAAGYVFDLSNDMKIKPSVLVKTTPQILDPVIDANLSLLLKELFWIGALYRTTQEVGVILSTHSIKNMKIGYSFEYPINPLNTNSLYGSHELMISLAIAGRKTKISSPRYY